MIAIKPLQPRYALLKRMAMLCVVLVLAIASISAFIRLSNAGHGCADWPQCYGSRLRQVQQGIDVKAADSTAIVTARGLHRILAIAALITILVMTKACFFEKPVLWGDGAIVIALLMLALFLALLGRWTSGARVPAVAIGNLLGGFAMLALCWRLRENAGHRAAGHRTPRLLARISLGVLLAQIALGGLVSASYAGLSCTGFPDCGASWSLAPPFAAFNPWREPVFVAGAATNPLGAASHMAHRLGALAALLVLVPLCIAAFRSGRRRLAAAVAALVSIEAILGVLMVVSGLPLWAALAHNMAAALLLAVVLSLA